MRSRSVLGNKMPATAARTRRRFAVALLMLGPGGSTGMITGATSLLISSITFAQEKQALRPMNDSAPLLQPWQGPHGGVPPWHLVRVEDFVSQFDAALKIAHTEIDAVAEQTEPATFDNTILALESVGQTLERLETLFDVHSSSLNVGPIPDIERVVAPQLSQYADRIIQNDKLFRRIEAV